MKIIQTSDGSPTLFSQAYNQTFHSHHGALTESRHVFLEQSGVAERLQQRYPTTVLEIGFGTGLNFFLTAGLADASDTSLLFISLEKELLSSEVVREFASYLPNNISDWALQYAKERDCLPEIPESGCYRFHFGTHVELVLLIGNALNQSLDDYWTHAIYLDAFSPKENPELWTSGFARKLYKALEPEGTLVTYSASGAVRRALTEAGFTVTRCPGPKGGKREMVKAVRDDSMPG